MLTSIEVFDRSSSSARLACSQLNVVAALGRSLCQCLHLRQVALLSARDVASGSVADVYHDARERPGQSSHRCVRCMVPIRSVVMSSSYCGCGLETWLGDMSVEQTVLRLRTAFGCAFEIRESEIPVSSKRLHGVHTYTGCAGEICLAEQTMSDPIFDGTHRELSQIIDRASLPKLSQMRKYPPADCLFFVITLQ